VRLDRRIVHRFERSGDIVSTRTRSSVSELAYVHHRTTYCLALILAAASWMSPTASTSAAILRTTITVRVYQTAGLPSTLEQRALAEAETVLRAALVDVRWRQCTGLNPSTGCDAPLGPSELLLRIVQGGTPGQDTSATLGNALVVRRAGGVLATVYFSHVAWVAKAAKTDVAVLLGRVAAHELGHLMMHTPAHARRGLMRPNWTPGEVRRNRPADWAFTAEDVAAMRQPGPGY
jgi:hypothetical protein